MNSNNTTAIIESPQCVEISAWPAVLLYERSSRVQDVGLGHHGQGKISMTYTEEEKRLLDGETETARSNLHKTHKNNSTQSRTQNPNCILPEQKLDPTHVKLRVSSGVRL